MTAMTHVDASAALSTLAAIERSAQTIGEDTAALLGGLQSALHSVLKPRTPTPRPTSRHTLLCAVACLLTASLHAAVGTELGGLHDSVPKLGRKYCI